MNEYAQSSSFLFPFELSEEKVIDMLNTISKHDKLQIKFEIIKSKNRTEKISGEIYEKDRLSNPAYFFIPSIKDGKLFNKIQFETIPGYKTQESRIYEFKLWKRIISDIEKYLKNKKIL